MTKFADVGAELTILSAAIVSMFASFQILEA